MPLAANSSIFEGSRTMAMMCAGFTLFNKNEIVAVPRFPFAPVIAIMCFNFTQISGSHWQGNRTKPTVSPDYSVFHRCYAATRLLTNHNKRFYQYYAATPHGQGP